MAATFNVYTKIAGVLSGASIVAGDLSAPSTITTSADVSSDKVYAVGATTTAVVLTIGAGEDIASAVALVFIPTVAGNLVITGATAADNSAIVCTANVPVVLSSGNTLPYQNTASNRIDETAAAITSVSFRNTSATAGKIRVLAIG